MTRRFYEEREMTRAEGFTSRSRVREAELSGIKSAGEKCHAGACRLTQDGWPGRRAGSQTPAPSSLGTQHLSARGRSSLLPAPLGVTASAHGRATAVQAGGSLSFLLRGLEMGVSWEDAL